MSIAKVAGLETEYGIMIAGAESSDPFFASDMLLRAYARMGYPVVPCTPAALVAPIEPQQRNARGSSSDVFSTMRVSEVHTDMLLSNGARFYIDHAHPEYSTPECLTARQLVAADKAGERILAACLYAVNHSGMLPPDQTLLLYKNNSDYKRNSYGCHENYLISAALFNDLVYQKIHRLFRYLLPFLVTRILFCGSGKVGSERAGSPAGFQLSQRADFFERLIGLQTMQQRPLFNTRDEPHADSHRFRRLHVILGDANMAEYSTYLKVGTMQLLLRMLEDRFIRADYTLSDPLHAIQVISRDLMFSQPLRLETGRQMTALDIQRGYLHLAERYLQQKGGSEEEWAVWQAWAEVLDLLPERSEYLAVRLDWAIKRRILSHYLQQQNCTWEQVAAWQPIIEQMNQTGALALARQEAAAAHLAWRDYEQQREIYFALRRLDLDYHDIRHDSTQEMGLFYRLQHGEAIQRLVTEEAIQQLVTLPPPDTRAWLRGHCIARFAPQISAADWSCLRFSLPVDRYNYSEELLPFMDPTMGTQTQLASIWPDLATPGQVIEHITSSQQVFKGEQHERTKAKTSTTGAGTTSESAE